MSTRTARVLAFLVCIGALFLGQPNATAEDPDLTGQWYGVGEAQSVDAGGLLSIFVFQYAPGLYAGILDIHVLGIDDTLVPVTLDGDVVTIGDPSSLALVGEVEGDSISGTNLLPLPIPPYFDLVDWTVWKDDGQGDAPGVPPADACDGLPDLFCTGSTAHCSALVPFEPVDGPGYVNYPANGETSSDQYRSYLRRDLRQIVMYATAKVACMTEAWTYWPLTPLGLGDMSEADGSIPGSLIGFPSHPPGTHEDGLDIDLAYFQLFAPDNRLRPVGVHHDEFLVDQGRLLAPPYALDVWRTALLIAYASEHPRVRVIGVDGEAGLLLDEALDDLVDLGWIDADLRDSIPLAYELVDMGLGWFLSHHHHLHLSLSPLSDILQSLDLTPETLNSKSKGKWITAYLELAAGHDVSTIAADEVALILDGQRLLRAVPGHSHVGDHDKDGIPDLMVKFDRRRLLDAVGSGLVELTLTGRAGGLFFQGTDTVRVIHRGK